MATNEKQVFLKANLQELFPNTLRNLEEGNVAQKKKKAAGEDTKKTQG
jgi:hypothetical protein